MSEKLISKELNLIGQGTIVEGSIRTKGNIRIDGKVTGEVHSSENLAVGAGGEIDGGLSGKNVVIGGRVKGNVSSVEKLVLESKSVVQGDIRAQRIVVDEGAIFDGHVAMTDKNGLRHATDAETSPDQAARLAQQKQQKG
ncbi:MAG TPA: polymer-forming cytoskeletal protein [Bacteroidota bacterium]|nr:polymer-forming cytoskeletal protein [Bacteroidota bacterium]